MENFDPKHLRKTILRMAYNAQCAHLACAFSIVEILSALYDGVMDLERDHLILSKGHGAMALYACLNQLGKVSDEEIENYLKDGTRLHGLAEFDGSGARCATGSLGHGLPVATGISLGSKRLGQDFRVFVIVGDGELQEGSNWEALQFASSHGLSNLTLIIDNNGWQAMGRTSSVLSLAPLDRKLEAFGFRTLQADGHHVEVLKEKLSQSNSVAPTAIIANTIKGYGVSFSADDNSYHYKRLTKDLYEKAVSELG